MLPDSGMALSMLSRRKWLIALHKVLAQVRFFNFVTQRSFLRESQFYTVGYRKQGHIVSAVRFFYIV